MNVKDLFSKGENGVLTYDQFKQFADEMKAKFVDLSEGNYVDKNKFTDEVANKDKQIEALKGDISKRDGDLAGLQEKLKNAGNDVEKLNQVSTELSTLQGKYDEDMKNFKAQLTQQAYEFAVKDYANTKEFTSNAAKRDFISEMTAKRLSFEGGKIMGADDFASEYAKVNEDAFKAAAPAQPNPDDKKPQFAGSTNAGNDGKGDKPMFDFNFTGVRPHESN